MKSMVEKTTWNLRVVAEDRQPARVYVRKHQFTVGVPLQFDPEYGQITALEYALGALAADVVGGLQSISHRRRLTLNNVEAVVSGELNNPLTYLGVVGETGHPGLEHVHMIVYVSSPGSEEDIAQIWKETLQKSPLVNTLKRAVKLDLAIKLIV